MNQATDLTVFSELENDILDAWNLLHQLNELDPHPELLAEMEKQHRSLLKCAHEWHEKGRKA